MNRHQLIERLVSSTEERQVEDAYNEAILSEFKDARITYPCKCDGRFEVSVDGRRGIILIEYKYDERLKTATDQAKILAQVVSYLHMFEENGLPLPGVCLVADKNECFVQHTNPLLKYLGMEEVDWSMAPSEAWKCYPLVSALTSDEELNPFVYDVNEGFDFSAVAKKIRELVSGTVKLIRPNERNVDRIFDIFSKRVLKESVSANDAVGIFFSLMTGDEDTYRHPSKRGVLVHGSEHVRINDKEFSAFISHFDTNCTPREKSRLSAVCDRLIEDTTRRKKGEFYTPTIFVDFTHLRIERVLGPDWKDEYVVWDCCCGTKNLTRDYRFKELYCSTLEKSELDISERYNPEAVSFQFDFLNDDFEKLPDGLKDAFRSKKKIVFLMNPPYGTAANMGANTSHKGGISETLIKNFMKSDKIGRCSENLLAQFLYRCEKLKKNFESDVSLAFFCNPIYLSGSTYGKFRDKFLNDFKYEDGFLFNAGHFSDTASSWGINFSIWTSGETTDKNNFKHDLVDTDENGEIIKVGEKNIYNCDGKILLNQWTREPIKYLKTYEEPNLCSGVVVRSENADNRGKNIKGHIGYLVSAGTDVYHSAQAVAIFSSAYGNGNGHGITASNFLRCTCAFTARKLVENTWINQKDEYLAPDTTNPNFHQFELDSVIYSLFHSSSQQSSLRQIDYKGKKWDIKNEFFWMSKNEMMDIANEFRNDETYHDARISDERFVYKFIQSHLNEFSPEAKAVLDMATELVRESFKYRQMWGEDHENYQIGNWDCGFYQIKALLKDMMPDRLKEFRELYRKFSEKLLPMVYELEFLKK